MPVRESDPCEPVVRATYIPAVHRAGVQGNRAEKLLFLEEARHRAVLAKRSLRSVRCRTASCGSVNVFNPAAEAGSITACISCTRPLLSEVK